MPAAHDIAAALPFNLLWFFAFMGPAWVIGFYVAFAFIAADHLRPGDMRPLTRRSIGRSCAGATFAALCAGAYEYREQRESHHLAAELLATPTFVTASVDGEGAGRMLTLRRTRHIVQVDTVRIAHLVAVDTIWREAAEARVPLKDALRAVGEAQVTALFAADLTDPQ